MAEHPKTNSGLARPLKIAVFSDSAFPILNGVSVSIDALIQELRERGHSVFLYTSSSPGHKDEDPNVRRFPALITPFAKSYPLALPPFYHLWPEFRDQEFDLVHTHTPFTVGFVGMRWADSAEIPFVTTYHTHYDKYIHYIPLFPKRYLRFKIAKHTNWLYNRADHVVTPSLASLRWLRRHSVDSPITVIPTGVPKPRLIDRADARARLGISPDSKIMLYVGRIAEEKNLKVLLRAAELAFKEDPSLRLWMVGDGPYRKECLALARKLGIGDRVKLVGFVPRADVDDYYAACDMFVFASMTETQGLVVIEAMTYGLPALVVRGGGAGSAVQEGINGRLLGNSPNEMAEAVVELAKNDSLAAEMSQGARRTSRELTVAGMADRMEEVYASVLPHRLLKEQRV